jgi:YHS domain-containing protein
MIRNLFRFIVLIVLLAVVRSVIGTIMRTVSHVMKPQAQPAPEAPTSRVVGELKQDPVCGTFIPVATSIKKTVNGGVVHFCSTECRDKYKLA